MQQEEFINKYIEVTINKLQESVKENLLNTAKAEFFTKQIEELQKTIKDLQAKHESELEALRVQYEADMLGKARQMEEMVENFQRVRKEDLINAHQGAAADRLEWNAEKDMLEKKIIKLQEKMAARKAKTRTVKKEPVLEPVPVPEEIVLIVEEPAKKDDFDY